MKGGVASMMDYTHLPKKFLRIKELTFLLPDDFEGTVDEAMDLFMEYRAAHKRDKKFSDPDGLFSTLQCLVAADDGERVCGEEAIYELQGGVYRLISATNPYLHKSKEDDQ